MHTPAAAAFENVILGLFIGAFIICVFCTLYHGNKYLCDRYYSKNASEDAALLVLVEIMALLLISITIYSLRILHNEILLEMAKTCS